MRTTLLAVAFSVSMPSNAGYDEVRLLNFETCQAFAIQNGYIWPQEDQERIERIRQTLSSDQSDLQATTITEKQTEKRYYGACRGNLDFHRSRKATITCEGEPGFPLTEGAVFEFDSKRHPWIAFCVQKCGKSKAHRLYWIDTGEDELEEGDHLVNQGFLRDRKTFADKCSVRPPY